jgi:oligopeptide/dipeptide ABC transporter ATP-binding protein
MRSQFGSAVILITHDLGVIAEMADRVAVMYAGQIVEQAAVITLFKKPLHPYTVGLIGSTPVLGKVREKLDVIPGSVPNLVNLPVGCRFAPRCQARLNHGLTVCTEKEPDLIQVGEGHTVRCWLYQDSDRHTAPLKNKSL